MAKIKAIAPEQIVQRLKLENPWWGGQETAYSTLPRRLYFDLFVLQVEQEVRRAVVLMGPRRVGKTVLLQQYVAHAIAAGTPPQKIAYVSIDAPLYNNLALEDLFALCRQASGDAHPAGYTMIFDEIQYLKNWEVHLKTLVDFFPSTKFIVSGSAAAALRLKSNESGAGRFTDFMLPPLTFREYLEFKGASNLVHDLILKHPVDHRPVLIAESSDYSALNAHFLEYLNYGGYPEVLFNTAIRNDPGRFIRSDIIDKVLLRDLPSLYGIQDVQELNSLFNVIAWNSGQEFNLTGLAQESGVDKRTIKKYLEYLEAAFLIKILHPVGINSKRFLRESRMKIFLTNPSMRCALFSPLESDDAHMGAMVETALVAQYLHWGTTPLHYAAWSGGEVDLVMAGNGGKIDWVMEIKWSNQYYNRPSKLRSLLRYAAENGLQQVHCTTIDQAAVKQVQDVVLIFSPAAAVCESVGRSYFQVRKHMDQTLYSNERQRRDG